MSRWWGVRHVRWCIERWFLRMEAVNLLSPKWELLDDACFLKVMLIMRDDYRKCELIWKGRA
jgi:hypothetical protein